MPCPHLNDFSKSEVRATWYSSQEIYGIKADCMETIRMMLEGPASRQEHAKKNNETFCPRGLEHRTPAGSKLRQQHKYAVWDAVLEAQDQQWEQHCFDVVALAQASLSCTYHCAKAARMSGLRDEQAVQTFDGKTTVRTESVKDPLTSALSKYVVMRMRDHSPTTTIGPPVRSAASPRAA